MAKRVSLKGKGAELFFGDYPAPPSPAPAEALGAVAPELPADGPNGAPPTTAPAAGENVGPEASATAEPAATAPPRARRQRQPVSQPAAVSEQLGNHDSKLASTRASYKREEIEAIRRVVKTPGREVSFVRLTPEEKGQLAEVVYTFKRQGQKTTENEINRIAINALLADYRANGEQSVLAKVLAALQA